MARSECAGFIGFLDPAYKTRDDVRKKIRRDTPDCERSVAIHLVNGYELSINRRATLAMMKCCFFNFFLLL